MLGNPRLDVLALVKHRAIELVKSRTHVRGPPLAQRRRADAEHVRHLGRVQEILLMFLFHSLPPASNLERKQKKLLRKPRRTEGIKASSISVSTGALLVVVSPVTLSDIASRSALIPDGNPASKTGRVLDL